MATATYIGTDVATSGDWVGVYGSQGFYRVEPGVVASLVNPPAWLTSAANNGVSNGWAASPGNPWSDYAMTIRTSRIFQGTPTTILTLTVNDSAPHRYAVYLWDGGSSSRAMRVDVTDHADVVLATFTTPTNLSAGRWVIFEATGSIKVKVTNAAASTTSFCSGVWFDPAASSPQPGRLLSLGGPDGLAYIC